MTRMGAEVVTGACDKHEKPQGEGCRTQEENPGVCMGPADQVWASTFPSQETINSVFGNPLYEGLFHELSMPLGMDDTGNG